jgi:hypothetical protein
MTWAERLQWFEKTRMSKNRGRDAHVVLNGRKESLQPFIRGGIRKISSKDLYRRPKRENEGWRYANEKFSTLKEGTSSVFSCVGGSTPLGVTGAAGASDILSG